MHSVSQRYTQKQYRQGMASMSCKKRLSNYAEQLVSSYATYNDDSYQLSISELPESSQNELARLYIEATDREVSECVYGNDLSINNDYTCALLEMLKNDCQGTRDNFAEVTRRNTISYYKKTLQKIIDDACDEYLHLMNNEAGFYAHRDQENGEICWSR